MKELCVPAKREQLDTVLSFIGGGLENTGCTPLEETQILIAVEEIFVNICSYAYPSADGMTTVRMQITGDPAVVQIELADQGIPYDPLQQQAPDITLSAQERSIGGLGVFMVKESMDEVCYRYENHSNILTIRKKIGS